MKKIPFSKWIEIFDRLVKFGWSTEEILSYTKKKYGEFYPTAKPYLNFDYNDGID